MADLWVKLAEKLKMQNLCPAAVHLHTRRGRSLNIKFPVAHSHRTIGKQPEQITPRTVIANHGQRNLASAHDHEIFNHFRYGLLQDKIKQHSTSKRIVGCFAFNSDG